MNYSECGEGLHVDDLEVGRAQIPPPTNKNKNKNESTTTDTDTELLKQ